MELVKSGLELLNNHVALDKSVVPVIQVSDDVLGVLLSFEHLGVVLQDVGARLDHFGQTVTRLVVG